MKLNNLLLHCGGAHVDREQLESIKTPEAQNRWHPIAHHHLVQQVRSGLEATGMQVVGEAHAVNRQGAQYFGLMQVVLSNQEHDDWGTIVGIRNSHDKSFAASLAIGAQVFVCDNLSFNGQVVLARRHTTNIMRDLPQVTTRAIARLSEHSGATQARADAYQEHAVSNHEAHDLLIRALDAGAITMTMVPKVLDQWRAPNHPEFKDRNLWSLYNGFTEVLKGGLLKLPVRSQSLHGMMDSHCGLTANAHDSTLALPA